MQVPENADKDMWLPRLNNDSASSRPREPSYSKCEMYKDPGNHSLGLQPCLDGYEFHMEDNEWNVISEVRFPHNFITSTTKLA